MKNEKGISLVELIVVVAILAIVLTISIAGIGSLASQRITASSKRIYNMLGNAQQVAMSKGDTLFGLMYNEGHVTAYTFSKGYKDTTYSVVKKDDLSNVIVVTITDKDGNRYTIGDSTLNGATAITGMVININRSTGSFSKDNGGGTYKLTDPFAGIISAAAISTANEIADCVKISLVKQNGDSVDINLVPLTGKFFYD